MNKGKNVNDSTKTKYTPNDRLKRDKVKEDDKVKVLVNDRVKRESISKVIKTNVKVPLSPNRKTNTNNPPPQTHVTKMNKVNPSSSIDKPLPKINKKPGLQTYAVNYCMCGSRKGKRNTLDEEEIIDTYVKSSNDILQETHQPSVRRSKPILSLPSPESFPQNKTKNKPSCGSNCVCLNKVPSSKSIDKLLETLMKWKCDLNASNVECTEYNCPYGIDSVIKIKGSNNNEMVQELVDSISNTIKSRSTAGIGPPIPQELQNRKKNTPSTPITLASDNTNPPMEGNINLSMHPLTITNTESEYMGAINLEKSNENNCKCTFRVDKTTVDMDVNTDICSIQPRELIRKNRSQDINAVFSRTRPTYKEASEISEKKHLNGSTRSSFNDRKVLKKYDDRSIEGKDLYYKPSQIHNRASQVDGSVRLFLDSLKEIVEDKSNVVEDKSTIFKKSSIVENKSKILENQLIVVEDKSKMVDGRSIDCNRDQTLNIDHIIKPPLICPCDCDYSIKFMGVTLRDANENTNTNKIIGNEQKQQENVDKFDHGSREKDTNIHQIQQNSNMDFGQYFSNVTSKLSLGKLVDTWQYNGNNYRQEPSRLCNINISAFKELIASLNKHDSYQDKALDTKSLAGTIVSKQSACVCCFKDKEEAQNLELNTFHLLKEHLKEKWDEFRENCHSSCVPPEEENKAFTLLLAKIKQTISEATDQAICKCADGEPTDGTWKRAYSLLQEYLKNKISRVHCKCSYPMEYNETLIPDVSAKVCILIEKDFQRLKNLCKCLNKSITDKDGLDLTCSFQLPEKDINNRGKVSKQVSNTSIIITQTASAQVQPNLVMATKSCEVVPEAIEPENGVEIIHLSSGSKNHITNTAEFMVSQCHISTVDKGSSHELKYVAPIPSINIKSMDIPKDEGTHNKETLLSAIEVKESQNEHNQLSLPLIGYTVDCTCGSYLGTCVCPKATVQKNHRKIEEIWYDTLCASNKKVNDESTSYIMNNVKSTKSKSVDKMCLHEIPPHICIHHLISIDNVQQVNRDVMDKKTSPENLCMDLMLKDSSDKLKCSTHDVTNTDAEITSSPESDNCADGSFGEWYEYVPQTIPDITKTRPVRAPVQPCLTRRKSETQADNFSKPHLQTCDCGTVPICHVKMLVKNIERKLILSDCICDSMNSQVCPIHSRKNL